VKQYLFKFLVATAVFSVWATVLFPFQSGTLIFETLESGKQNIISSAVSPVGEHLRGAVQLALFKVAESVDGLRCG
jgi:hypothetical protein